MGYTEPNDAVLDVVGGLIELRVLDLRGDYLWKPGIDDSGLARLGSLKNLVQLDLRGNKRITDAGAETLGHLRNLTWLNVDGCEITDTGLQHLHTCRGLSFLNLGVSPVTDRAIEDLRGAIDSDDIEIHRTTLEEWDDQMDRAF